MLNLAVRLVITMVIILGLGWLTYDAVKPPKKLGWPESLSYAYLLGSGIISLNLFLQYLVLGELSVQVGLRLAAGLSMVALVAHRVVDRWWSPAQVLNEPRESMPAGREEALLRVLKTLLGAMVLFAFFETIIRPVTGYDAWAIWLFKAKVFFVSRTIDISFLQDPFRSFTHPDYPVLTSLLSTFAYFMLGQVNDRGALILFSSFYLSLLVIFRAWAFRLTQNRILSDLFSLFLATTPVVVGQGGYWEAGYADLPLAAYLFSGFVWLASYLRSSDWHELWLGSTFLGLAAFTKNEGVVYFMIAFIVVAIVSLRKSFELSPGRKSKERTLRLKLKQILVILVFFVIASLFWLPWQVFRSSLGLKTDLFAGIVWDVSFFLERVSRLPVVVKGYLLEALIFSKWQLSLSFVLLLIVLGFRVVMRDAALRTLIIFLAGAVTAQISIYLITPYDLAWHLSSSLSRLLLQIFPLALFSAFLITHHLLRSKSGG